MMVSFLSGGDFTLIQATADTVLMRRVPQDPSLLQTIASVLSALMSLAILALAAAIIPAARNFRKTYAKVDALMGELNKEIMPVLKQTGSVIANLEHITTSVRDDLGVVRTSIKLAHEKLEQAVGQTEQRLNDFNALIEVVQDEAESVFVATASTVRGVRTGAASLHHEDDDEEADEPPLPPSEELQDVHNHSNQSQAGTARPRLRKHHRRR